LLMIILLPIELLKLMDKPKYLAIKTEFGEIIVGKRGEHHIEIVIRNKLEIEKNTIERGYIDSEGKYQLA